MLTNKHIIVGIGAGISAYKALELIRLLKRLGATVVAAPTKNATQFVTQLSLEALSQNSCLIEPLQMNAGQISHVEQGHLADLIVIAPATANLLAKMAHGLADEILLQTLLSFKGPVVVAPAMETNMWTHPATQANVELLKKRGVIFIGPESGPLASGRAGIGRMAEPSDILEVILDALSPKDYEGITALITAGPTHEPIDPVRHLANKSSGKMGVALAKALARRGATVHLVHGPLSVALPKSGRIIGHAVQTATQMHDEVIQLIGQTQLAIMCAAVSDFRPQKVAAQKIKRASKDLETLHLVENPDILAQVGKRANKPFLVGFAAETTDLEKNAIGKCRQKNCDLICGNDVSQSSSSFGSDTNQVIIVDQNKVIEKLPVLSKDETAHRILDVVSKVASSFLTNRGPP